MRLEHGNSKAGKEQRERLLAKGQKWCSGCSEILPVDDFSKSSRSRDGMQATCRECGSKMRRAAVDKNPRHYREYQRKRFAEYRKTSRGWVSVATSAAKVRASENGEPFDIDPAYVESILPDGMVCPVFGVVMEVGGDRNSSPSIDKVRPELGYVRGNVRVISYRANRIKNDATVDELRAVLRYVEENER